MERNGTVEVTSRQDGSHVEIAFQDDGPGIGEEEQKKIFTAFYSTKDDGTGLGLAISSKIIESYGGSLRVESRKNGTGACLIVSLPKSQETVV